MTAPADVEVDADGASTGAWEDRYRARVCDRAHPESHVVRLHRHVLAASAAGGGLGIGSGLVYEFGCGSGANLRYFMDRGYRVAGCDVSIAAVARAQAAMPSGARVFSVPARRPLLDVIPGTVDFFLADQVLYLLPEDEIKHVVAQAVRALRPGGAFAASMASWRFWYGRHASPSPPRRTSGLRRVVLPAAGRQGPLEMCVRFSEPQALADLFAPLEEHHLGEFDLGDLRADEGPHHHWLWIGRRAAS